MDQISPEAEFQEFNNRCNSLHKSISSLRVVEDSSRVWISVLTNLVARIVNAHKSPEDALNQFIEVLKSHIENKDGS